jgi:hypothetical protein
MELPRPRCLTARRRQTLHRLSPNSVSTPRVRKPTRPPSEAFLAVGIGEGDYEVAAPPLQDQRRGVTGDALQDGFPDLLSTLLQMSNTELHARCKDWASNSSERPPELRASFLFWLSARERAAWGTDKDDLARLGATLVTLKDQLGGRVVRQT